jgi:hypothetical protein
LADAVDGGATDIAELAELTGCDPDALHRLMRHLVNLGVFSYVPPEGFCLDRLGVPLLSSSPLVDQLDQDDPAVRALDEITPSLLASVRSGAPSWRDRHGVEFWPYMSATPDRSRAFDEMMAARGMRVGDELAARVGWTEVDVVTDVGGGTGTVLSTLLHAHPHLRGALVDRDGTVQRARHRFEEEGLADRIDFHGQSFFDPLPPTADVLLLSRVLHDWPDEQCIQILRRCRDAAAPRSGQVMVAERLLDEAGGRGRLAVTNHDLVLMLTVGGRNRTASEFQALGAAAGLDLTGVAEPRPGEAFALLQFAPRP